jgi:hypothetical protein
VQVFSQYSISFLLAVYELPLVDIVLSFKHGLCPVSVVQSVLKIALVYCVCLEELNSAWAIRYSILQGPLELERVIFDGPRYQNTIFPLPLIGDNFIVFRHRAELSLAFSLSFAKFALVHPIFGDKCAANIRQDVEARGDEGDALVDHILVDDAQVVAPLVVDEIAVAVELPLFLVRVHVIVVLVNI